MNDGEPQTDEPGSEIKSSVASQCCNLFANMQEAVVLHELVVDDQGEPIDYRIIDANHQFEVQTGFKRSAIVGKLASQVYGVSPAPFLKEFASVALGGGPRKLEAQHSASDRVSSISVVCTGPKGFATILADITDAKAQAEAIEKNRLSLRALLDVQPHLVWLKDHEGRFLAVNNAFAQACGQPNPEAVVGKTDLDVWPVSLAEAYRADDANVILAGSQKVVEELIADVDGARWYETYKSPVFAPDGSIVGTTGISRDITDRKRNEEQRLQAERKLGKILDFAPEPIAVINARDEWTFVNQAFCELCGYQRAELVGRKISELDLWDDSDVAARVAQQSDRASVDNGFEGILRSRNGVRHYVEFAITVAEFDEATSRILVGRDVTRSRLAEASAARSRERLLSVSELAHIGHYVIDLVGGAVSWTPELFRIVGRDAESYQPTLEGVRQLLHGEDVPLANAAVELALSTGQAQRLNLRVVRPDGEVRHCLTIIEVERNDGSQGPRVHGLMQDLTELRRAEEERRTLELQVMQSQKLESLGVLAGGIAHDFNNLLTSILGNADLARLELEPNDPVQSYLCDIDQVSRRAADLCRQMLAYSGKGRFVVQPISLNALVREMAHLLSVSISKKVVLKFDFFDNLPCVIADGTQMRQVVMNLITNASEAIGNSSGLVTLSTGVMDYCADDHKEFICDSGSLPAGRYVLVEVTDTGCGMSEETRSRIFDPFFTTKFTGRGLGLAAVLGIVRGHKGGLQVISELGRGTTFRILLPAHHATPVAMVSEDNSDADWRSEGLVLLADDEESIREMGRRVLERAGFEVLLAVDGREALEQIAQHRGRLRLVILDMTMPSLDGEACYRKLRELDPELKVLMTSGYNEQEVIRRFEGQGLAGFIQKPYRGSDLIPVIRKVLGDQEI
jgi:PAS domain S-box-containing protein